MDVRKAILSKFRKLGERIIELSDSDCKGVHTATLTMSYNIVKHTMAEVLDEQEALSIDEVADRYSVTIPTVYNWIEKHGLPKPERIEDKCRVKVYRDTIEQLDALYPHKN